MKELGASPLPEMIEDIQSRRKGVAGGNRSEMERLSEELEETDLASTCSVPEIPRK